MAKAHIHSIDSGTVQIGNMMFEPRTGSTCRCTRRPQQIQDFKIEVQVPDKSMESAKTALRAAGDIYLFF